jgi:uncharacterized protein
MRDPVLVDSVEFARDAGELRGILSVAELPRLQDALFDRTGDITYSLAGEVDKDDIESLRLDIAGDLLLVCQRCLGPVKFSLKSARKFVLVPKAQALGDPAEEPDGVERIHADTELDVTALAEDEAILSLPMSAVHQPGECSPPLVAGSEGGRKSPFSSLTALKRQ